MIASITVERIAIMPQAIPVPWQLICASWEWQRLFVVVGASVSFA
jgi:hypothetical protein